MNAATKVAVLIVNDRESDLLALTEALRPLHLEVLTALSARDGLKVAQTTELAVAIVDIVMPDTDGFAMVAQMRAAEPTRGLPVIFVSSLESSRELLERVYALGAADFVPLPACGNELRSKVAVFAELHRQKQQLGEQAREIMRSADARLRAQHERLQLFMETASDYALFFMDPQGVISEWTAGAENVLGFSEEEAVGRHCSIIFAPEDIARGLPAREMSEAAGHGQETDERWHVRKGGGRFFAVGRLIALRDETGTIRGFTKILRDATATKQAEAELREALNRFESLAESMAQMAWMADPSGARFWFNQRWFHYTGTTLAQVRGWGFAETFHPAEREAVLQQIREHFAAGTAWTSSWRVRGEDGNYRWFLMQAAPVRDPDGKIVRWFGTNTDIHEQVVLQREMQASEQKFREIFETANEGIWILNNEGRIEMVNQRMAEILGYDMPEIVGRLKTDFVFPEDVGYVRKLFDERRTGKVASVDVRFRRKDGTPIWTLLSGRPLARNGKFAGALDMFTDISARKSAAMQFEEELKSQVAQRTTALREKTAQLESFAYTVAHDLRSPLRAISGYAEFTLEDFRTVLPAGAVENLGKIRASAARLDVLIRDLLSYSRISQIEFEEHDVPLASSVEWAVEQLRSEIDRKSAVVEIASEFPLVRGERSIIDQVALNLVSNAIKFVAPGVTPHITIGAETQNGVVRLLVRDNGVGVPKEYHERIFRVFERLEGSSRFAGTGVGLAIVARAAERLGGRAGVESQPGQGSTFWVEFKKAGA